MSCPLGGYLMNANKNIIVNTDTLIKVCSFLISLLLVVLSCSAVAETENNFNEGNKYSIRSPRSKNPDAEPNNDFSTAVPVIYHSSGTTHITIASVGASDPRDFWRLEVDRGTHRYESGKLMGTDDPVRVTVLLHFNETNSPGNGVVMSIYDAERHKLGTTDVAVEGDANVVELITQVNSYFYVEVFSNPSTSNFKYVLDIIDNSIEFNPAYRNDEKFSTATDLNITTGVVLSDAEVQYLDKGYDFADFYKFNASYNQKIVIDLQPSSNSNDDFDMFLFDGPSKNDLIKSAEKIKQNEHMEYYSPYIDTHTYYLRVAVKNIADEILRNQGYYTLIITGNLPPQWNNSFPDRYIIYEDGKSLILDMPSAFHDLNFNDHVQIETWDPSIDPIGDWTSILTTISLKNATVELREDGSYKVKPKPNKFGTELIKVRATDDLGENYTYKNIKIIIKPTNDPPVLNGTNKWIISGGLTPSNDGYQITGQEGENFVCTVTAYEPFDPWDVITFSDNTDLFDINPTTGKISFVADYTFTGPHKIEITAHDNGTPPLNTTKEFKIIIEPSDEYPEVELVNPPPNSIQSSLYPMFTWRQVNEQFFDISINYDLYLSTDRVKVEDLSKAALVANLTDKNVWTPKTKLTDQSKYYWTVIPNDGLHLGKCISGIRSFETNTKIPIPKVKLQTPFNNQIIVTNTVTLTWNLEYTGSDKVSYDVYFGVSFEELSDPLFEPRATVTKKLYEVKNLYYEKNYYWKIVPFTDKVRANMSMSEIFRFYLDKQIPKIELISPANNSIILPTKNIVLSWEINYTKPGKIGCVLYVGTSQNLQDVKGIVLGNNQSYVLSGLSKDIYYWKIIPYLEELRGQDSEIWKFTIKDVEVPRAVLINPVNTTLYSSGKNIFVTLQWSVQYGGIYDPNNVWYEVYLDNSTNIIGDMTRLVVPNYKLTFKNVILPFEQNITYYWYVIPHLKTDEGSLTGYCKQGVAYFEFGDPVKVYKLSLSLETETISIDPGTLKIIYFIVKNQGNQKTTVDISTSLHSEEDEQYITPTLPVRTSTIAVGSSVNLTLNILVLKNAKLKTYNLTIKATALESTVVTAQETLAIKVGGDIVNGPKDGDDEKASDNSLLIGGILIVIIVIILVVIAFLFLSKGKKKKKEAEKVRISDRERIGEPEPFFAGGMESPEITTTSHAPQVKVSTTPVHRVAPAAPQPTLPPVGKVELIAKPVAARPVAAKPVAAKPVTAKPVAAKPVTAKPVAAKPITAQPVQAQPAKTQSPKPTTTESTSTTKEGEKQ